MFGRGKKKVERAAEKAHYDAIWKQLRELRHQMHTLEMEWDMMARRVNRNSVQVVRDRHREAG